MQFKSLLYNCSFFVYIFYVTLKYSQLKWWFTVIPQILKQSNKIATNFDRTSAIIGNEWLHRQNYSYDHVLISTTLKSGAAELNLPKALLGWVISLGNGDIEIVVPGHVQKEYGI